MATTHFLVSQSPKRSSENEENLIQLRLDQRRDSGWYAVSNVREQNTMQTIFILRRDTISGASVHATIHTTYASYLQATASPGVREIFHTLKTVSLAAPSGRQLYLGQVMPWVSKQSLPTKHQRAIELFPAPGPLEYIAMDTSSFLLRLKGGNRFITIVTNQYSRLTRNIPSTGTIAVHTLLKFLDPWVICYS